MSMGVTRFSLLECIMNQNCIYFGSSIVQCQGRRNFIFQKRLHLSCGTLGKFSLCVPGTVCTSWQKWNPCGHWNEIAQWYVAAVFSIKRSLELTWTLRSQRYTAVGRTINSGSHHEFVVDHSRSLHYSGPTHLPTIFSAVRHYNQLVSFSFLLLEFFYYFKL